MITCSRCTCMLFRYSENHLSCVFNVKDSKSGRTQLFYRYINHHFFFISKWYRNGNIYHRSFQQMNYSALFQWECFVQAGNIWCLMTENIRKKFFSLIFYQIFRMNRAKIVQKELADRIILELSVLIGQGILLLLRQFHSWSVWWEVLAHPHLLTFQCTTEINNGITIFLGSYASIRSLFV